MRKEITFPGPLRQPDEPIRAPPNQVARDLAPALRKSPATSYRNVSLYRTADPSPRHQATSKGIAQYPMTRFGPGPMPPMNRPACHPEDSTLNRRSPGRNPRSEQTPRLSRRVAIAIEWGSKQGGQERSSNHYRPADDRSNSKENSGTTGLSANTPLGQHPGRMRLPCADTPTGRAFLSPD